MPNQYSKSSFICIIHIDKIHEHIFDMGEYLDDLESDIESFIESSDFFPCMHFESLSDHDWDEDEEILIADDAIVLLVVLQWEDETLPDDKSKLPADILKQAFETHSGADGVRGYFDRFTLYQTHFSRDALERIEEGWE